MVKKTEYGDKPYNRCLRCEYQRPSEEQCDGPRTSSMTTMRWREFMRDMKDVKGLTYADIERLAEYQIPLRTIQYQLSPAAKGDIERETARIIENAIMGSSGQYPCYLAFLDEMPESGKTVRELQAELQQLRSNIGRTHDFQEKELAEVRAEAQKKIDYLKAENERLHKSNERLHKLLEKLTED